MIDLSNYRPFINAGSFVFVPYFILSFGDGTQNRQAFVGMVEKDSPVGKSALSKSP